MSFLYLPQTNFFCSLLSLWIKKLKNSLGERIIWVDARFTKNNISALSEKRIKKHFEFKKNKSGNCHKCLTAHEYGHHIPLTIAMQHSSQLHACIFYMYVFFYLLVFSSTHTFVFIVLFDATAKCFNNEQNVRNRNEVKICVWEMLTEHRYIYVVWYMVTIRDKMVI